VAQASNFHAQANAVRIVDAAYAEHTFYQFGAGCLVRRAFRESDG
jgi:hypothetical protein